MVEMLELIPVAGYAMPTVAPGKAAPVAGLVIDTPAAMTTLVYCKDPVTRV